MTAVRDGLPEGRYGRRGEAVDARRDRVLKMVGAVLGAGMFVLIGWLGYTYITGQEVSAELMRYHVVSDDEVQVHLEVRKEKEAIGVCTVRSRSADGAEVGRADFTFDQRADRVDEIVTLRTISRATNAELVGCRSTE